VTSDAQISPPLGGSESGSGSGSGSEDAASVLAALAELEADAIRAVVVAGTVEALREAESVVAGKRSPLAGLQRRLGGLSPDERREVGRVVNAVRARLTEAVAGRRSDLEASARAVRLADDRLDLTEAAGLADAAALGQEAGWSLPWRGHLNLVTQTRDQLEDTFVALGFAVAEGPEAETDWYNFEALNMPPAHPARGMWDTLYLKLGAPETVLLRTHTSPVQVRLMESQAPPIYAVMPGRCYRRDTPDARHLPVFHQIEGLVVDPLNSSGSTPTAANTAGSTMPHPPSSIQPDCEHVRHPAPTFTPGCGRRTSLSPSPRPSSR
jgi:phenylalanyl-tRNA synthetase alpha chain